MAVLADPEGAVFSVWQARQMVGARVVNEAGSLNFNGLGTRDADAARAFYGSVFGWTTLDVGGGMEMWTLPGYGDDLERDNPDLRKMVAESGGPPGFEDVVAAINPIGDDQPDTPPHWSVTFATDDADASAAQGRRAGWDGGRPAARRSVGAHDGHPGPAGRHVHRQPVRPREQGPARPGVTGRPGRPGRPAMKRATV